MIREIKVIKPTDGFISKFYTKCPLISEKLYFNKFI